MFIYYLDGSGVRVIKQPSLALQDLMYFLFVISDPRM